MRQAMQRAYMELKTDVPDLATDWAFIARFHVDGAKAPAADTVSILAETLLTNGAQVIVANIANPAVPRNLQVAGNAAGIVGNVTIHGTGYDGKVISETFALNGLTTVVGDKAFKSITEVDLPVYTNGATDAVSVGLGVKLGLPFKLSFDVVLAAFLNGVKEATPPTIAKDAANLENNTIALNSALNNTDVDIFLVV